MSRPLPTFALRVGVAAAALAALVATPNVAWAAPSFDELRGQGWLWAYLGVFVAGFGTSLTPCVYPMITITVGIFGAKEATSRARAFFLALMYTLGMATMYSSLGVVMALVGNASGAGHLLSRPEVVLPIVVLYAILAASMFGAFELQLPSGLQAKLSGVGGKGTLGAFLMGLVGGFTAAPCTGPLLFGLLAFVASTRSVPLGFSLMFVYAAGMGVLFLLIATFAMSLPKSGRWMDLVKAIGGMALVVVGIYFLRPIVPAIASLTSPATWFLATSAAVTVVGLALLWGHLRLGHGRVAQLVKAAGIVVGIAGAAGVVNWSLTPKVALAWRLDREVALAEAKAAGKPVLLDFAADWCAPCKRFEVEIFAHPTVHAELVDRYVTVKVDVTKNTPADRAMQKQWNAGALPTVLLLGPDGQEVHRFQGELPSVTEFLRAVQSVR